ncbi:sodium:proton antiporter NhaD [Marinifilum flexuosum]|uniref:Sodium/proton antiporter (NhaD family) n=1 Tax=Marinifilum flexuosum TaxID=1117708 RepID=A0A419X8F3_9BACT|nr:sodium:proton antiporter NhaD [Marinifilum flexuosum]RKE03972.1 sodium/proton antiporter (NhaD family) [Marinifilum flexuosum]
MFALMVVVFVLGYTAIALEHPLKIDKAASALLIGVLTWTIYVFGGVDILSSGVSRAWNEYVAHNPGMDNANGMLDFITHHEVLHHLSEISTILFFLLGAMTIVEIVDQHQGFKIITDKIKTTNKVKLLWVLSVLTFFMSAALDNLTTTIVIVALIRKLIDDQKDRWFFASMVVLAANAGGAWSPIGDVTTIMLWIGGQVTTINIITRVIVPSLFTMIVPLIIVSTYLKGHITRPALTEGEDKEYTTHKERVFILCLGVASLLFVPVFKTTTHLPPYLGMLFGLGVMWVVTEIMHRNKDHEFKSRLNVTGVLKKVDVPTVLFFLGILSAVASMQSAGHLDILASWLDKNVHDIYIINLIIGVLSSIVDNVPLVAAAMGMYPIEGAEAVGYASNFVQDGLFWEFLAYCAGTGGSMLIIGSAAGVAAMGMEKIDFIWYLKKITLLAFVGYLAGAGVYYLQAMLLH